MVLYNIPINLALELPHCLFLTLGNTGNVIYVLYSKLTWTFPPFCP